MAFAASAAIQSQGPLEPFTANANSLLGPRRASFRPATAVDLAPTPAMKSVRERRWSAFINLPTSLSSLLRLQPIEKDPEVNPAAALNLRTPTLSPKEDVSSLRDEIHGDADWSRLLDPLHPLLRREIIKYGEFAQGTYDGFDFNPFSEFCGSCLYGRGRLFEKLGLARNGYGVTKYIYAMSHVELPQWLERSMHADTWSKDSNWMGFVAVSDDAETRRIGCRDIVVAWRGTVTPAEWLEDVQRTLEPLGDGGRDEVKVEHGFLSIYTSKSAATRYNKSSASEQVMAEIRRLVDYYRGRGEEVSLTITGHSLGGALALLNAYEAASTVPDLPVTVISFGAPRVGNPAFRDKLKELDVKALRVVVKQDVVPKMPGLLMNDTLEKVPGTRDWVYAHVGLELAVDVKSSPFLKHSSVDVVGFHSLETYLHLVDGHVHAGREFRRNARRDVALVNKATGMLRDELRIPPCWYQSANKGMVCNAHGRWVLPERAQEDVPSPYRNQPQVHTLYA